MTVTKRIQIDFADPSVRAIDYLHDIRKAAESAGLNLYSRHDVKLQTPMPTEDGKVVVDVKIPRNIAESFSIGNHLRGISNFMLRQCAPRYQPFVMGTRLLMYTEVLESDQHKSYDMLDRLEAIAEFARLLEHSDDKALQQINRIMKILKENSLEDIQNDDIC